MLASRQGEHRLEPAAPHVTRAKECGQLLHRQYIAQTGRRITIGTEVVKYHTCA